MLRSALLASLALSLLAAAGASAEIAPYQLTVRPVTHFNLGLGAGPMYGSGGANLEYFANSWLGLTAGVGMHHDPGWFAGARIYLKPDGTGPRPRITLGVAQMSSQFISISAGSGSPKPILAVGATWATARNGYSGIDFDLTTEGTISVGYHF